MKRIFVLLISIPLIFISCEKEDEITNNSPIEEIWTKTFGDPNVAENGARILNALDGGFIVGVHKNELNFQNPEIIILKTNTNGNLQWSKTIQSNNLIGIFICSIIQNNDGSIIVLANEHISPGINYDVIIKLNENGQELWRKTFMTGGYTSQNGNSIQKTNDGGYLICGELIENHISVMKISDNGDSLWSKEYGLGVGLEIQETNDGGFIFSATEFGDNLYLFKINDDGMVQWSNIYMNAGWGTSIIQSNDNGYVVSGTKGNLSDNSSDIHLTKVNENGQEEWRKIYDSSFPESWCSSLIKTENDGLMIFGGSLSPGENTDIYIIKTDVFGNIEWEKNFGEELNGTVGQALALPNNQYIFTGTKYTSSGRDVYLQKFREK